MTLLALDLGTKTGYAIGADQSCVVTGVFDFMSKRHEGGGMRYLRFRRKLDEMHAATPISEVAYEEVAHHNGTAAAHVYGGLLGQLTAWCEEHGVPYEGVPVGTIKKFATGKGNAPKGKMIEAARLWGFEPATHDEADAICLFLLRTMDI